MIDENANTADLTIPTELTALTLKIDFTAFITRIALLQSLRLRALGKR
jgi:hypothetical protein